MCGGPGVGKGCGGLCSLRLGGGLGGGGLGSEDVWVGGLGEVRGFGLGGRGLGSGGVCAVRSRSDL